jgi:acyl-CoA thioesterase I
MKDEKLTLIILKSLLKDPHQATYDEWIKAGDFALEIRFFPHAFHCFQNAMSLEKNNFIANKLNDVLDKVTNVLEFVPSQLAPRIEEIRFNNPLDPSKWLQISNELLKDEDSDPEAIKFALSVCAYCTMRSQFQSAPITEVLSNFKQDKDLSNWVSPKIQLNKILEIKSPEEEIKVVAMGDNVTLGLQSNWEVKFNETYHFLWTQELSKKIKRKINLANCGVSGAGVLDAALYLGRDAIHYKPDLLLIHYGINDAWLGKEALLPYEMLLDSIIKILKKHTEVVLLGPVPHIPENCPENQRPTLVDLSEVQIQAWSEAAKAVAARNHIPFADTMAEFPSSHKDRIRYFANKFNQTNLEGHKLIKSALDKLLV